MCQRVCHCTDLRQKFDVGDFWADRSGISGSGANLTKIPGALHEDQNYVLLLPVTCFRRKNIVVQYDIFILLSITCSWTTPTQHAMLRFHCHSSYANAPRCCVLRELPHCCVLRELHLSFTWDRFPSARMLLPDYSLLQVLLRNNCVGGNSEIVANCRSSESSGESVFPETSAAMSQYFRKRLPSWASFYGNLCRHEPVFFRKLSRHEPVFPGKSAAMIQFFPETSAVMS